MMEPHIFLKRFSHALRGLLTVFQSEQSFRFQCLATIVVVFLSFFLHISRSEFMVILLLSVSVMTLEVINTIFERMVDTFKPRIHPIVKDVKDMMAAAVLLASVCALVIGIYIFVPYVQLLFFG